MLSFIAITVAAAIVSSLSCLWAYGAWTLCVAAGEWLGGFLVAVAERREAVAARVAEAVRRYESAR